jgi:predicted Ser/Thr protein kinase
MAVVYRATQLATDRPVALKVMAAKYARDRAYRGRFARESRVASLIDHPNVIPIYGAGEEDGALYIIMKFVEGSNLQEILVRSRRVDSFRAVRLTDQVAAALDVAHAQSLVHRDIKPANVLIDGSTGHAYLTDFGLAKAINDSSITDTDHVMGTVRYAAPERLRGEDNGTVRGDVYSLGCLLWDLLAGTDRPAPDSISDIPPALRSVVKKAIRAEPMDRYGTAGELAQAAAAAIQPAPVPEPQDAALTERRVPAAEGATSRAVTLEAGGSTLLWPPPSRPGERGAFGPEAISAGLRDRVRRLCDDILRRLQEDDDAPRRQLVAAVRRELDEPLRIAVAGRVSAGKSTLVNALLGRRIAETGRGETTDVVAWYRHGTPERIEVRLRNGDRFQRGLLSDGSLPELGVDPQEISEIDVRLQVDSLRSMTIIDTPGLSSLTEQRSESAKAVLGIDDEQRAIERAEALLYAMSGDAHADDQDALKAFRDLFEGTARASAVNTIGVLTKIDEAGDSHDPWPEAYAKAQRLRDVLGPLVSTVVPFVGLLAETANSGVLDEHDARDLRALAALNADRPDSMLEEPDAFLKAKVPIRADARRTLFDHLGLFGLERAFELAAADQLTGVGLARRIRELSGIDLLRKHMDGFDQRTDALKAEAALKALDDLSSRDRRLGFVRDEVQRVRDEPAMHVLELFGALDNCAVRRVRLREGMMHELDRLVTGHSLTRRLGLADDASTAELRRVAFARHRVWKAFEVNPSTSAAAGHVAFAVSRFYQILLNQAADAERGAA